MPIIAQIHLIFEFFQFIQISNKEAIIKDLFGKIKNK
jgi:hypothetical protein